MEKIILTGFGVFAANTVNPTEIIVNALSHDDGISSYILPVVYDRCADAIGNTDGNIYLHLGLASSRNVITVEKYAYNEKRASSADNDGILFSGEKIRDDGPDTLTTPFDAESIVNALVSRGIESRISSDPGRYVCNNIYYHSLLRGRKALFVHLPPFEKLAEERALEAVKAVIGELRAQSLSF